jgi:hypothetical protein
LVQTASWDQEKKKNLKKTLKYKVENGKGEDSDIVRRAFVLFKVLRVSWPAFPIQNPKPVHWLPANQVPNRNNLVSQPNQLTITLQLAPPLDFPVSHYQTN